MRIDTPITASAATLERALQTTLPKILVFYHQTLPADVEAAMKQLAKNTAEKLLIVKLDTSENPALNSQYQLSQGLPVLIAWREGKEIARTHNGTPATLQNYADYLTGKTSEIVKEAPATAKPTHKPVNITDSSFAEVVLASDKPVLVDFWAAWCGPCRAVAPTLEKLAGEFAGKAVIAKLDVDQNPRTSQLFRVQSIPTLLVFKNGKLVDQAVGALPEPTLRKLIQKHV